MNKSIFYNIIKKTVKFNYLRYYESIVEIVRLNNALNCVYIIKLFSTLNVVINNYKPTYFSMLFWHSFIIVYCTDCVMHRFFKGNKEIAIFIVIVIIMSIYY